MRTLAEARAEASGSEFHPFGATGATIRPNCDMEFLPPQNAGACGRAPMIAQIRASHGRAARFAQNAASFASRLPCG
jgi:hypothetical protein